MAKPPVATGNRASIADVDKAVTLTTGGRQSAEKQVSNNKNKNCKFIYGEGDAPEKHFLGKHGQCAVNQCISAF